MSRACTEREILDALQSHAIGGVSLSCARWEELGLRPSKHAIRRVFGSWRAACAAAGILHAKERPIEVHGTTASVPLTKGFAATIDAADVPLVDPYLWYAMCRNGGRRGCDRYALATRPGTRNDAIKMHRLIANCPDSLEVDHINGDGLDNRRCNLRIVNHASNMKNTRRYAPRTSRFFGVYRLRQPKLRPTWRGAWRAHVRVDGQAVSLGCFQDEEAAARAVDAAIVHYGLAMAKLNFPSEVRL